MLFIQNFMVRKFTRRDKYGRIRGDIMIITTLDKDKNIVLPNVTDRQWCTNLHLGYLGSKNKKN